ncbi:MAG: PD-(D/E)XK nuclease family protein, partial [Candidatus Rokuibacteriota bacterium]
ADLRDRRAATTAVETAAARLNESGARVAAARRLVEVALETPPYRRAAQARRALREVPLAAVVDGRLVEGILDLLFEAPQERLVAVEVKLAPADDQARVQLGAYCAALAAAGRRVTEAWLLVLRPDGADTIPVPLPPVLGARTAAECSMLPRAGDGAPARPTPTREAG